jgi:hypothetical protein
LTSGGVFKSQDVGENWELEPASRTFESDARQLQVENGITITFCHLFY